MLIKPPATAANEAPGLPLLPNDLPPGVRLREGIFLPDRLALSLDAWVGYMALQYPALCQQKLDDCGEACVDRIAVAQAEWRESITEPLPWWSWASSGVAVGVAATVVGILLLR